MYFMLNLTESVGLNYVFIYRSYITLFEEENCSVAMIVRLTNCEVANNSMIALILKSHTNLEWRRYWRCWLAPLCSSRGWTGCI